LKSERIAFPRLAGLVPCIMVSHVMEFLRAISLFPASYVFNLSRGTELVYSLNGNIHGLSDGVACDTQQAGKIHTNSKCLRMFSKCLSLAELAHVFVISGSQRNLHRKFNDVCLHEILRGLSSHG
jgi:hypothetical protein